MIYLEVDFDYSCTIEVINKCIKSNKTRLFLVLVIDTGCIASLTVSNTGNQYKTHCLVNPAKHAWFSIHTHTPALTRTAHITTVGRHRRPPQWFRYHSAQCADPMLTVRSYSIYTAWYSTIVSYDAELQTGGAAHNETSICVECDSANIRRVTETDNVGVNSSCFITSRDNEPFIHKAVPKVIIWYDVEKWYAFHGGMRVRNKTFFFFAKQSEMTKQLNNRNDSERKSNHIIK